MHVKLKYLLTGIIVLIAILVAGIKYWDYVTNPWTRNGQVMAQVVQVTPRVSGTIVHLPIVDFAAKWDVDAASYHLTPRKFGLEAREPELAGEIERLTRACWDAFEMAGYARVDFRVDAKGAPLILEVNANPCLAPDAGFAAAAHRAGLSYDGVIAAIVAAAVRRLARVPECTR